MHFKYNYNDEFKTFNFLKSPVKPKKSKKSKKQKLALPRAYFEQRKVSTEKKKDLLSLVKDGVIPEYAAQYFSSLPVDKSVKDEQYYDDDEVNLLDEEMEIVNLELSD